VILLIIALGLSGCGVGPTDRPVDEGDSAAAGAGPDTSVQTPKSPDSARSADDLVRNFLQAAAGGLSAANENMKKYLTPNALSAWVDPVPAENPSLSVVRVVGGPTIGEAVDRRTRVTLDYQLIGTMTDQGRIDELVAPVATRSLTFWVVADPETPTNKVRIDEIVGWPGGLLLSDEGLQNYYQMQPIYFWDMEYRLLVPDLRYLPLTKTPDQRARQILDWLVAGPSPWLVSGVQRLPNGSAAQSATDKDGTLSVGLSAQAAGSGDREALRRLMFQLQWSLASLSADASPRIELRLDEQVTPVAVSENEFRGYNHSYSFNLTEPVRYEINAQRTVVASSGAAVPALNAPENSNVLSAAVGADGAVAAFVRDANGRRAVQVVRAGLASILSGAQTSATPGRPSFVPASDYVLVPTGGGGGRLLAVSTVDGSYDEASHALTGVTTAAISPDGRRVAVVAGGEVSVSSLVVSNNKVTVASSSQRQILTGRLTARSVTWTSESWLLVAGTNGPSQALWRVSADGVLAEDLSSRVGGLVVEDLVCYPRWTGVSQWTTRGAVKTLAITSSGLYTFRNTFDPEQPAIKPFFGT
jgi:hypothetical protein